MPKFWKGALCGSIAGVILGGFAAWLLLGVLREPRPPGLIEARVVDETWPGGLPAEKKLGPLLQAAFPKGTQVAALRAELSQVGFSIDTERRRATYDFGDFVCNKDFSVAWHEEHGALTSIGGTFASGCL